MPGIQQPNFHHTWCWFEQEIVYARNYNILPGLSGAFPSVAPGNPILDKLLPGLLTIKAVALLDEGLKVKVAQILAPGTSPPKDLHGRIEILAQRGHLSNPTELHEIRRHRNVLAHESGWHISWDEMTHTVAAIRASLQVLGIVGVIPHYQIEGERSALRDSGDPQALFERTIRVVVKAGGKEASEISFTQKLMRDDA